MKRKFFLAIITFLMLIGSVYLYTIKHYNKKYYSGTINFNTTILGNKATEDGLMLSLFDLKQKNVEKILVKYKNASKNDLVTSIQSNKAYYLIQSTNSKVTDKIIDVEHKKVIDLGWRGHSVVGENDNSILLAKYEVDKWKLLLFDKSNKTTKDTGFYEMYSDNSGVRIHHGMFSNETGIWYVPYTYNKGTYCIFFKEGEFYKEKLSDNEISDLWVLNANNESITFYGGYEGATNANSISLMQPKLYNLKVNKDNKLTLNTIINFDVKTLGKDSNFIGYYKKSKNEYLFIFRTRESMIRTVLINTDNKNIKVVKTTSSIDDVKATKIYNGIIAVANYDKAIFFDKNGSIIFEKESNKN